MRFTAASIFLAVVANASTVDATLPASKSILTASKLQGPSGWFIGSNFRGGSMGKTDMLAA
jgi:hypothetical protein